MYRTRTLPAAPRVRRRAAVLAPGGPGTTGTRRGSCRCRWARGSACCAPRAIAAQPSGLGVAWGPRTSPRTRPARRARRVRADRRAARGHGMTSIGGGARDRTDVRFRAPARSGRPPSDTRTPPNPNRRAGEKARRFVAPETSADCPWEGERAVGCPAVGMSDAEGTVGAPGRAWPRPGRLGRLGRCGERALPLSAVRARSFGLVPVSSRDIRPGVCGIARGFVTLRFFRHGLDAPKVPVRAAPRFGTEWSSAQISSARRDGRTSR